MARWEDLAQRGWEPRRRVAVDSTSPAEARDRQLDAIAGAAFDGLRAYGNCARSTLIAVTSHLELPAENVACACLGLAGGIAGTGETCGAVIGGLAALGLGLGSSGVADAQAQERVRNAAATYVAQIRALLGGTRCFDIQEHLVGFRNDTPAKEEAWKAAGGHIACALVCGEAARAAAALILACRHAPDLPASPAARERAP